MVMTLYVYIVFPSLCLIFIHGTCLAMFDTVIGLFKFSSHGPCGKCCLL